MRIVIAGMGFLGEYLLPGYKALSPDLSSSVAAVKGSKKGLSEKQRRIPFPVSAGDLQEVLQRQEPDIVVFAPPPEKARCIFREDIAPYFRESYKKGKTCVLYSFVPDIEPGWFSKEAGLALPAVKIMPSMAEPIGEVDPSPLGANLYTAAGPWNLQQKECLQRFLSPFGESFLLKDEDTMAFLAGKITSHLCCNIAMTISDSAARLGLHITTQKIGEAIRYFHRNRWKEAGTDPAPASLDGVPEVLVEFLKKTEIAWFSGILDFTYSRTLSISRHEAERISHLSFEMNVLSVQLEDRHKLERNTRNHATPGGLLEKGCVLYKMYVEKELRNAIEEGLAGGSLQSFFDLLEGWSFLITLSVCRHGGRLGQ